MSLNKHVLSFLPTEPDTEACVYIYIYIYILINIYCCIITCKIQIQPKNIFFKFKYIFIHIWLFLIQTHWYMHSNITQTILGWGQYSRSRSHYIQTTHTINKSTFVTNRRDFTLLNNTMCMTIYKWTVQQHKYKIFSLQLFKYQYHSQVWISTYNSSMQT